MADNTAEFLIKIDAAGDGLTQVFTQLKQRIRSDVGDIESTIKNANLFGSLQKQAADAQSVVDGLRAKFDVLQATIKTIENSGGKFTGELEKGLASLQKQLTPAQKTLDAANAAVNKLAASLKLAGVDTTNFAFAQTKLAESLRLASVAALEQSNKNTLGLKTLRDIQPEINQLNAAYNALRDSGKLSFGELSLAQARLQEKTAALRAEVGTLGGSLQGLYGKFLALVAGAGLLTEGIGAAREAAREFETGIVRIGTITQLSKDQLDQLGAGARELAVRFGVDLTEATKRLYEIIQSGISPDNALKVLEESAKAAIAGITDLGSATTLSSQLISAFHVPVDELSKTLDQLFQASKDGGPTLAELSKSIGELAPIATAAHVPLSEITAALTVLKNSGLDVPTAIAGLSKAIQGLNTPTTETRAAMRGLGIEFNGLVGTLGQVAAKATTLDQLKALFPDARSLKIIASLTDNFGALNGELTKLGGSVGGIEAANRALENTPEERTKRFNAALHELNTTVGQFIGTGSPVVQVLTDVINKFNALDPATKSNVLSFVAVTGGLGALFAALKALQIPLNILASKLPELRGPLAALVSGLDAATIAVRAFGVAAVGIAAFDLGKHLYEEAAAARFWGDQLGLVAARASNLAELVAGKLTGAITGNGAAIKEAEATYERNAAIIGGAYSASITGASEKLFQLNLEHDRLVAKLKEVSQGADDAAKSVGDSIGKLSSDLKAQIAVIDASIAKVRDSLGGIATDLAANVAAAQQLLTQSVADIKTAAQEQIAQLDRIGQSDQDRAAQALTIEIESASKRIKVIQDTSKQILDAFDAEAKAKLALAQGSSEKVKQVEQELTTARQAILGQVVNAYRAQVNELVALENGLVNQIKGIDQRRVDANQAIENQISAIRAQGLGAFEVYQQKVSQIQDLIGKATLLALQGESAQAEKYASQAVSLIGGVTQATEASGKVVVSADEAQTKQISLLRDAQAALNLAFDKGKQSASESLTNVQTAAKPAQDALASVTKDYDALREKTKEGITVAMAADTKAIDLQLGELTTNIEQRALLVPIAAQVDEFNTIIANIRSDLQEKGLDATIVPRLEALKAAIKTLQDEAPQILLKTDEAVGKVDALKTAVGKIADVKVEIQTNADQVKGILDKLDGRQITSTHQLESNVDKVSSAFYDLKDKRVTSYQDIVVTRIEAKAAGGLVGEALARTPAADVFQHYARGGSVFAGRKVPGSGNSDTYPAALESGSFVVRKSASQYYGDSLMGQISRGLTAVRRFASGGSAKPKPKPGEEITELGDGIYSSNQAETKSSDGYFADLYKTESEYATDRPAGQIDAPTLPSDKKARETLILDYIDKVARAARTEDGGFWTRPIAELQTLTATYQRHPSDSALEAALATARSIGLNLGITHQEHTGFDVDGRTFHKELATAPAGLGSPHLYKYDFYAGGGDVGTDTVPALLTPGEWVVPRNAVLNYGAGLLHALNQMTIPRDWLENIVNPPIPAARYADGGYVGSATPILTNSSAPKAGNTMINHITVDANDVLSEDNIRRKLLPILNSILRRTA